MKFTLDFKTPDVVFYTLDGMEEIDRVACENAARKFVKYGEIVTIEIDTVTGEATVIPVR